MVSHFGTQVQEEPPSGAGAKTSRRMHLELSLRLSTAYPQGGRAGRAAVDQGEAFCDNFMRYAIVPVWSLWRDIEHSIMLTTQNVVARNAGNAGVETIVGVHSFASAVFTSAEEFLGGEAASKMSCLALDINLSGISGIQLRSQLSARQDRCRCGRVGHGSLSRSLPRAQTAAPSRSIRRSSSSRARCRFLESRWPARARAAAGSGKRKASAPCSRPEPSSRCRGLRG